MSILSNLFGGGKNPANSAMPYLNQISGVGHQGYDPYINQGQDASGKTKSQYEDLMNDPSGFINKLMENYKTSEGYNFQKDILGKEMSNTAAAGGIAGTPLDQMNQAQGIQGLLSQDMQQYLSNVLGRYDTGLKGEEGIAGRGYDASKQLTDLLGGNLNQQANLGFQGQQQKNANQNALMQSLMKLLGQAGSFGGGGLFGGMTSGMFGGS